MTAYVRVFTHAALITAPVSSASGRLSTDSVSQLKQPYLAGERLTTDTSTIATTSVDTAHASAKLAYVQVQSGKQVYYEVTTGTDLRTVTSASPVMRGDTVLHFGPQWRLSVLEVTDGDA